MKYEINQSFELKRGNNEIITATITKIIKKQYKLESPDCAIPLFLSEETLDRCQKITQDFLAITSCQENSDSVPADFT